MNRTSKIVGGAGIAAAAVAAMAVPAYAVTATHSSAPAISIPGSTAGTRTAGDTTSADTASNTTPTNGLAALNAMSAAVAKDFGTDSAGLKAGLMSGKSLAQIAASNQVSRSTLLTRLDARVTAIMPKLINIALPVGAMGGKMPAMPNMPGAPEGKHGDAMGMNGAAMAGQLGLISAVTSVSTTLKLTPMELFAEVMKGQTLQQIATTQKVSTAKLLASLNKEANAVIAKIVDVKPPAK